MESPSSINFIGNMNNNAFSLARHLAREGKHQQYIAMPMKRDSFLHLLTLTLVIHQII